MAKDKRDKSVLKAIHDHIAARRRDKAFKERLKRSMEEHRDILDRLAK